MILEGFHRGASAWVATFVYNDRTFLAWYNRTNSKWEYAKWHLIDPLTRSEIDEELTEELVKWLKAKGLMPEK